MVMNLFQLKLLEEHKKYDMPLGWFLPNDGYGCGYGQESTQDGNVANLKQFADEAISKGVQTGLWTQSNYIQQIHQTQNQMNEIWIKR